MFKNLSKFNIRKAMAWVDMPELGPKARILIKPATEANPNYYNAMLALSGKRVRAMVKTDKITAEDAALNRDDDVISHPTVRTECNCGITMCGSSILSPIQKLN